MKTIKTLSSLIFIMLVSVSANSQFVDLKPDILRYEPFVWKSEIPEDCPFESLKVIIGDDPTGSHYGMVFQKIEFMK